MVVPATLKFRLVVVTKRSGNFGISNQGSVNPIVDFTQSVINWDWNGSVKVTYDKDLVIVSKLAFAILLVERVTNLVLEQIQYSPTGLEGSNCFEMPLELFDVESFGCLVQSHPVCTIFL